MLLNCVLLLLQIVKKLQAFNASFSMLSSLLFVATAVRARGAMRRMAAGLERIITGSGKRHDGEVGMMDRKKTSLVLIRQVLTAAEQWSDS